MKLTELTKDEFLKKVYNFEIHPDEWKYEGDKPCIVDFFATWCGPCKTLAPILEEIGKEFEQQIDIYKIDIDKENELAAAFGIRSVPTMLLCPISENPQLLQGAAPKSELKRAVEQFLLKRA